MDSGVASQQNGSEVLSVCSLHVVPACMFSLQDKGPDLLRSQINSTKLRVLVLLHVMFCM